MAKSLHTNDIIWLLFFVHLVGVWCSSVWYGVDCVFVFLCRQWIKRAQTSHLHTFLEEKLKQWLRQWTKRKLCWLKLWIINKCIHFCALSPYTYNNSCTFHIYELWQYFFRSISLAFIAFLTFCINTIFSIELLGVSRFLPCDDVKFTKVKTVRVRFKYISSFKVDDIVEKYSYFILAGWFIIVILSNFIAHRPCHIHQTGTDIRTPLRLNLFKLHNGLDYGLSNACVLLKENLCLNRKHHLNESALSMNEQMPWISLSISHF